MPRIASVLSLLCLLACLPAAAAAPTALARFNDWSVFTETVNGETMCFAATRATDMAPKSTDHGDVWFYVSNWRSGKARSQPSLKVGYTLRSDLPGRASVGRANWTLFGVGQEAFTQDSDDAKLVREIKGGSELRVEATSERNTRVTYHFSLAGSSAAIERAASACR